MVSEVEFKYYLSTNLKYLLIEYIIWTKVDFYYFLKILKANLSYNLKICSTII